MKKLRWLILVVAAMMGLALFAACSPSEPQTTTYTVTYYDGSNVLKTERVEEGGKATNWTPQRKDIILKVGGLPPDLLTNLNLKR